MSKSTVGRKIVAMALSLLLIVTLLPYSALAVGDGDGESNSDAMSVDAFMSINDAPAEFSSNTNPYGYGEGVPFMTAPQNELLKFTSYDVNKSQDKKLSYMRWQDFETGTIGDNNISKSKMSTMHAFKSGDEYPDMQKAYQYTRAVGLDPFGSGRRDVSYGRIDAQGRESGSRAGRGVHEQRPGVAHMRGIGRRGRVLSRARVRRHEVPLSAARCRLCQAPPRRARRIGRRHHGHRRWGRRHPPLRRLRRRRRRAVQPGRSSYPTCANEG